MRDQIAKLAEAQKAAIADAVDNNGSRAYGRFTEMSDTFDFPALLAEFDRLSKIEAALESVKQWAEAYPLDVFPEPDLKKAAQLLKAGGITLDAVSASSMRHVLNGVVKIIDAALNAKGQP